MLLHGFCGGCCILTIYFWLEIGIETCISQFSLKVCPFFSFISFSFSTFPLLFLLSSDIQVYCEWTLSIHVSFTLQLSIELRGTNGDFFLHLVWRIFFSVIKHKSGSFIYEPNGTFLNKCGCWGFFPYPIKFMHHRIGLRAGIWPSNGLELWSIQNASIITMSMSTLTKWRGQKKYSSCFCVDENSKAKNSHIWAFRIVCQVVMGKKSNPFYRLRWVSVKIWTYFRLSLPYITTFQQKLIPLNPVHTRVLCYL